MVVDLPAPFGPRNPVTTPGSTTKLSRSTAVLSPYRLVSPSISIMLCPFHQALPMQGTLRSAPPGAIYPRTTPPLPLKLSGIGPQAGSLPRAGRWPVTVEPFGLILVPGAGGAGQVLDQGPDSRDHAPVGQPSAASQ